MQTDGKGPVEVQQRLRNILAGVGDADLPLGLRLLDQLVVRPLQEILKILQILQVSPCVVYPPILVFDSDAGKRASCLSLHAVIRNNFNNLFI